MSKSIFKELPVEVVTAIHEADAVVFEGFDMTGKSYLISKINSAYNDMNRRTFSYRPDWEGCLNDKVISRGNRYIPGIVLFDIWKNLFKDDPTAPKLLIDRWLAVSYVYGLLYDQESDYHSLTDLVKGHTDSVGDKNIIFIYKCHENVEEAREFYEKVQTGDNDHNDIYDKFRDFADYYNSYLRADDLYRNFFNTKCKFKVYCLSSINNKLLNIIN